MSSMTAKAVTQGNSVLKNQKSKIKNKQTNKKHLSSEKGQAHRELYLVDLRKGTREGDLTCVSHMQSTLMINKS